MIDNIILYNTLGWATFPVNQKTKEPMCKDWPGRTADPLGCTAEEDAYNKAGAYGIVLRPQDLIFDVDPRNFKNNINPWHKLKAELGLDKIQTPAVKTGGGGVHIYFLKPENFNAKYVLKGFDGMEIKSGGKGAYVIGPGSGHESGNKYKFVGALPLEKVFMAPKVLLDYVEKRAEVLQEGSGLTGGKQEYRRYCEWLKTCEPAISGQNGNHTTYKVAVKARDFGLPVQDAYSALSVHYNPRCEPEWSAEELTTIVKNAYNYASGTPGIEDPALKFKVIEREWDEYLTDGKFKWDEDKSHRPKPTLKNAVNYLYSMGELCDTVRLNKFTGDIEMTGRVPWWDKRAPNEAWTDTDIVLLKYYLAREKEMPKEFTAATLWEALHTASIKHSYHPIQDWVAGLKWDGQKRLDKWLIKYCNAPDNPYVRAVGRKTLVAMIARVFDPGIKFDYCLILEGAQGVGKSTVCAILGGKWYGDIVLDPHGRDTIDAMRGKWVIELSEMEVTKRADIQALKAFLSRTTDRARLAYARSALDFPRQCVFIGTVNPDGMGYLNDDTGNRRFWPVACGAIDMTGLAEVREQLLAEAYEAYKKKESLHLSKDLEKFAAMEQEHRMMDDPWGEVFQAWFKENPDVTELTLSQAWELVMGGQAKNMNRSEQMRVGRVLQKLGFFKQRTRGTNGARYSVYRRDDKDMRRYFQEELGVKI